MSFQNDRHSVLPDAERFRTTVKSQMRSCQYTEIPCHSPYRELKGYVHMTNHWTGIFNIIKKSGTYRGMPVLNPYQKENEGLLTYDNKEDAIQALLTFLKPHFIEPYEFYLGRNFIGYFSEGKQCLNSIFFIIVRQQTFIFFLIWI